MGRKKSKDGTELSMHPATFNEKILGWSIAEETRKKIVKLKERVEEDFTWLTEILVEAKKAFSSAEIQLLPKTPSAKRCNRIRPVQVETTEEDEDEEEMPKRKRSRGATKVRKGLKLEDVSCDSTADESDTGSTRSTRSRACKTRSTKSQNSGANTRSSRRGKKSAEPANGPEPVFSLNASIASSVSEVIPEELEEVMVISSDENKTSQGEGEQPAAKVKDLEAQGAPTKREVPDSSGDLKHTEDQHSPTKPVTPELNKTGASKTKTPGSASNSSFTGSPKPIPGFRLLHHVKQKARAYEHHVNSSHGEDGHSAGTSSDEVTTPTKNISRGANKLLSRTLNSPSKSTPKTATPPTPQTAVLKSQVTLTLSSKKTNNMLNGLRKCSVTSTPIGREDQKSNARTLGYSGHTDSPSQQRMDRRSSTSRHARTSVGKLRKSLSQRRSSTMKQKLCTNARLSSTLKDEKEKTKEAPKCRKGRSKMRVKNQEVPKELPETKKSSPLRAPSKLRTRKPTGLTPDGGKGAASSSEANTSSCDSPGMTPEVPKRTRSKLRLNKPPPPKLDSACDETDEMTEDDAEGATRTSKNTRSKLRLNKPANKLPTTATDSDVDMLSEDHDGAHSPTFATPKPVHRSTRSKMRKPLNGPQQLATTSSEDEATPTARTSGYQEPSTMAPCRSTRSKMRKGLQAQSPSELGQKRSQAMKDEASPPKRQCLENIASDMRNPSRNNGCESTTSQEMQSSEDEMIMKTPSPKCPSHKIIRPIHASSFLNHLKKPPSNVNTSINSFIQRNTPKQVTLKEKMEQRRKELANKERHMEDRLNKRQEQLQKKAEEQRRRREERQHLVAKRREEHDKKDVEMKKGLVQKLDDKKHYTTKLEDKLKDEREKQQRLRAKKMEEAELRRKQEETTRKQKLMESEQEQRMKEEILQRKREHEELERQRRVAELKKQEDERRAELERERQKEQEKIRHLEEQRSREEQDKQKHKEEKEKRERAERERAELERQKDKERLRQDELEKSREQERQRLLQEKAKQEAERQAREEERKIRAAIDKHNHALQNNSSMNTSSNTSNLAKPKLNTTVTYESTSPESYEITPAKKYKPPSAENYDIDDMRSDDSTDDEEAPRKKVPSWAQGAQLKAVLIHQFYHPPDLDEIFDTIGPLDLNLVFKKRKPRFNKRTSSAVWDSPILKPSGRP